MDNGRNDDWMNLKLADLNPFYEMIERVFDLVSINCRIEDFMGLVFDINGIFADFAIPGFIEKLVCNDAM